MGRRAVSFIWEQDLGLSCRSNPANKLRSGCSLAYGGGAKRDKVPQGGLELVMVPHHWLDLAVSPPAVAAVEEEAKPAETTSDNPFFQNAGLDTPMFSFVAFAAHLSRITNRPSVHCASLLGLSGACFLTHLVPPNNETVRSTKQGQARTSTASKLQWRRHETLASQRLSQPSAVSAAKVAWVPYPRMHMHMSTSSCQKVLFDLKVVSLCDGDVGSCRH
jgi:hypothetical protein